MINQLPALVFDLDGTITDSKPGILECLCETLETYQLSVPDPLDRFVGPPVEEWALELLPNRCEEERTAFARHYRACYDRQGWKNNSVFPGVETVLTQLSENGFSLYVCTSKQQHFAVRILEAFGLAHLFSGIYGDKAEYASHSKTDLLNALILERRLARDSCWMIGDRIFDFDAAHANNIRCVAAAWGYGPAEELVFAEAIAPTPEDLLPLVHPGYKKVAVSMGAELR